MPRGAQACSLGPPNSFAGTKYATIGGAPSVFNSARLRIELAHFAAFLTLRTTVFITHSAGEFATSSQWWFGMADVDDSPAFVLFVSQLTP